MRLSFKDGFVLASTLYASACVAQPAVAQEAPPAEKSTAIILEPRDQRIVRFNLQPNSEEKLKPFVIRSDVLEDQEKRYREQRFGKNMEIADGVFATVRPVRLTLTIPLSAGPN